eukprot:2628737-Rhodomonas_salina.2
MTARSEVADPYHWTTHRLTRTVCRGRSRKHRGTSATSSAAMPARDRNPIQDAAISIQFVPVMRFLVFDFGV